MKTIEANDNRIFFQGDVAFVRVDSIPTDAVLAKDSTVAHSETGHSHVATQAHVYAAPSGMELYIQAIGGHVDIVHNRSYDQHETIRMLTKPGDVFKVRRQREHTPSGWRRVED